MKKGVALLWVLVLSVVLLIISGTMVSYIVKESRFSVNIEDSAKAYAAAKTGIVWGEKEVGNSDCTSYTSTSPKVIIVDTSNSSKAKVTTDCTNKYITSIGTSGNVRRKLEYTVINEEANWKGVNSLTEPLDSVSLGENYVNSFELQFDFWPGEGSYPITGQIGLDNTLAGASDTNVIALAFDPYGSTRDLYLKTRGITGTTPETGATLNKINFKNKPGGGTYEFLDAVKRPYAYRANIKYVKNTSVSITIKEYNFATNEFICVGGVIVDVSNRSFGLFNNLDAEGSNGTVYRTNNTNSALGDGAFGELIGDLNKSAIRFDNIRIKSGDITLSPPPPSPTYYTLTVSSAGGGTVSGGGIFDAGTQGTALATPRSGYSFSNWGGDYNGCYSTNPALSVTMDENKTCTAYFLW